MTTKSIVLVLLALIMLIGPVISEDTLLVATNGVRFGYLDSTNGTGSFSSYNELGNQLKKTNYGSGTIENKIAIGSNQTIYLFQNSTNDFYSTSSAFAVLANSRMAYAPRFMTIGTGYYIAHPFHISIRLGDKFQIKNYASETSMVQETNYATAINGILKAGMTTKHSNKGYNYDAGKVAMSLSGKVADGTTHIGMVHSGTHDQHYDKGTWSIAAIDVDEVYTGTFNLKTNMSLSWPVVSIVSEDSWLPCCYGGWNNISLSGKKDFGSDAS